jgi:hypothetical protein
VSDLQHQHLIERSRELRLSAVPNLYCAIAQRAVAKAACFAGLACRARAREMFALAAGFPTVKTRRL